LITKLRDEADSDIGARMLVLDAGDLLHRSKRYPLLYADFFSKAYSVMEYDAVNLGDQEFYGGNARIEHIKEAAGFALISANVSAADPLWKPYAVKTFGSLRIAVLGVLYPGYSLANTAVSVTDPQLRVKQMLAELKGRADIFVLLSHMGYPRTVDLVKATPGIDIAVVGHMRQEPIEGKKINDTLVVGAGMKGEHIGVIDAAWDPVHQKIDALDHRLVPLGDDIPYDTRIIELVREFNQKADAQEEEAQRLKEAQQSESKEMIERLKKMTPEQFMEYYHNQLEKQQNIQK